MKTPPHLWPILPRRQNSQRQIVVYHTFILIKIAVLFADSMGYAREEINLAWRPLAMHPAERHTHPPVADQIASHRFGDDTASSLIAMIFSRRRRFFGLIAAAISLEEKADKSKNNPYSLMGHKP
jgi:hypothetical protein